MSPRTSLLWEDDAACLEQDPETMFPEGHGAQKRVAEVVCGACPVRSECLDRALTNNESHGVWGGTTERDRRAIKKAEARERAKARQQQTVAA